MKKNLKESKNYLKSKLYKEFYLGPMTKNVVDVIKSFNTNKNYFGLIPSRRQIETLALGSGYVNNWSTELFTEYVGPENIILRDHAGPMQGANNDDGKLSIKNDISSGINFIHVDPWKNSRNIKEGINQTLEFINYCESLSNNVFYEVGTEEAIFKYTPDELNKILKDIKQRLSPSVFNKIVFGVVQSGTSVTSLKNSGTFDKIKSKEMSDICHSYGLYSKEHNSDYLTDDEIMKRISCGVDSLNIAPEMGVIETKTIMTRMNKKTRNDFYDLCFKSNKWKKWIDPKKDIPSPEIISKICGHYVFASKAFKENIKPKLGDNIDDEVKYELTKRLETLCNLKK